MKEIKTTKAPAAIGPYSQGIAIDNLLYTSGQIPIIPETGELAEGVEAQAHQAIKNLSMIVKEAGAEMSDVIKTTVFIKDMNDFAKVNEVYGAYFGEDKPARSCVAVAALPKDGKVEIECIVALERD